jgi:transcriptional regulator with XRE-family HTH domain
MTIYQLSVKTGTLNSRAIYDFAAGRVKNPSFRTMEKIADALDVSMDELRENNPDIGGGD